MIEYEAPAKLNLALHVRPPRPDGYHPLESLVQTIEWIDSVSMAEAEGTDFLEVIGLDVEIDDNLVLKALAVVRASADLAAQRVALVKRIPVGAGLGGGSSDAAAALAAAAELAGLGDVSDLAVGIGADVPLFLTGGTLMMRGIGEMIEPLEPLTGFAVAVVVPQFEIATGDVYRRWDEMEGPTGEAIPPELLPPGLRDGIPVRNDLTPAALDLEPRLGDFMADLRSTWGGAVGMTGSGSGCYRIFPSLDEAADAARSIAAPVAEARGVELRDRGVAKVDLQD